MLPLSGFKPMTANRVAGCKRSCLFSLSNEVVLETLPLSAVEMSVLSVIVGMAFTAAHHIPVGARHVLCSGSWSGLPVKVTRLTLHSSSNADHHSPLLTISCPCQPAPTCADLLSCERHVQLQNMLCLAVNSASRHDLS